MLYSLEPSIKPTFAAGSEEAAGWQQTKKQEDISAGDGKEAVAEAAAEKTPRPRAVPGSNSFVPATAGLILAGQVIRDLAGV